MVEIEFLGPIAKPNLKLNIKSLVELKEALKGDEELQKWLEISAVALNDTIVDTLDIELKNGDKISILPPVCGG
ncbi:MAG: MoaD/ThiS family protein [Campylobacter sp.]|nr:MoaD/ThiS family protein [Campylobacter sp.]